MHFASLGFYSLIFFKFRAPVVWASLNLLFWKLLFLVVYRFSQSKLKFLIKIKCHIVEIKFKINKEFFQEVAQVSRFYHRFLINLIPVYRVLPPQKKSVSVWKSSTFEHLCQQNYLLIMFENVFHKFKKE